MLVKWTTLNCGLEVSRSNLWPDMGSPYRFSAVFFSPSRQLDCWYPKLYHGCFVSTKTHIHTPPPTNTPTHDRLSLFLSFQPLLYIFFSHAALTCRNKTVVKPYTPSIGMGTYTTSTGTAPAHLHYVHQIDPLNPELNPMCCLLALLRAHHLLHVSRIRIKSLTFRRLMSYIHGAPILDVSRSHTTTQHSR